MYSGMGNHSGLFDSFIYAEGPDPVTEPAHDPHAGYELGIVRTARDQVVDDPYPVPDRECVSGHL